MKEKKPTKNYKDLPDTIGIEDYMAWKGCGRAIADEVFHADGFPRIKNTGTKLIADKLAVRLYDLGLKDEQLEIVLKEVAKELV